MCLALEGQQVEKPNEKISPVGCGKTSSPNSLIAVNIICIDFSLK